MANALNQSLDISYWRKEFTKEKERLGKRWRKLLAGNFQAQYDSLHAAGMLSNVNMHRASLQLTVQVVSDMRQLERSEKKVVQDKGDSRRQQAIDASLKNLERPSTRILAQAKQRREVIKGKAEMRRAERKEKVNQTIND